MKLHLYNSYKREKESFEPIRDGYVGLYTCGPTVYDYAHIGNFRTFIFEDLLKRWLIHLGYDVKHVMNITDVDDKTIKKANDESVALNIITDRYTSCFMEDLKWLKMIPADEFPRATDYIDKMISMIQTLLDKNFAYKDNDGSVYFDINSFQEYGCLTNLNIKGQKQTKRINDDEYEKDSPQDFALWKGWKKEDGDIVWNAPWGKGRPGWHIECSAMSIDALGDHFDIHCGGIDNMFPHHENEIAQSVCSTGKPFVNYWLHSEFLLVDGGKMSKSLGNYYTIKDLINKGFSAESIRYQLLSGHYRTKISFSINKKHESDKVVERVSDFHELLSQKIKKISLDNSLPQIYSEFSNAMNDDLNTPQALAIFFEWMKYESKKIKDNSLSSKEISAAWNFLKIFNSIFDFVKIDSLIIPDKIKDMLNKRKKARQERDWILSDKIRISLKTAGWSVDDTPEGQKLKKI